MGKYKLAGVAVAPPERISEIDEEVLRTRLFGESKYDPAILGSVQNPNFVQVLIYDFEKLEDIRAHEMIQETRWQPDSEGNYDTPEGSPWTLAAGELSTEIATAFLNAKAPVPVIVSPAIEDPDSYPEDALIYEVAGDLWVSWAPEH